MSDSEISTDTESDGKYESESEDENFNHDCMYGNEPEYTVSELAQMGVHDEYNDDNDDDDDRDVEDDDDLENSRLINLHWCGCGQCQIMPTLIESKCCKEFSHLLGNKLDGVMCITNNEHFADICLKTHVLETAYMQNRRYNNKFTDVTTINNR